MKKFLCVLMLGAMCLCGCGANNTTEVALESRLITFTQETTTEDVASAVSPAIVGVSASTKAGQSVGSGVSVAEGGYILTNSHVINGSQNVKLHLVTGSTADATIIYEDTVLDLAILKSSKSLPYLQIGSSDEVRVGADVIAVGTPLSLTLSHTFTKGIVSATNRTIKVGSSSGEGYMQNLIQHDASLNPGNSGGPLLNKLGQVVGINTLKVSSGEGIGFAIPSKSFQSLLSSFVENINYQLPYLGVYGYDSSIARYYDGKSSKDGFYVIDVADSSPLKNCGVESGSVITELNGAKICSALDLKDELYKLNADSTVRIKFIKDGYVYNAKTKLCKNNF